MNDLPPKARARGRLLNWQQACERLNCSKAQFYRMVNEGHFVALVVGKKGVRITEASLEDYIERQIALFALEHGEFVSNLP